MEAFLFGIIIGLVILLLKNKGTPREGGGNAPNGQWSDNRRQEQFIYTRPQQGHSLVMHLLFGWILLYIPTLYVALSPRHYFHL